MKLHRGVHRVHFPASEAVMQSSFNASERSPTPLTANNLERNRGIVRQVRWSPQDFEGLGEFRDNGQRV